MWVLKWKSVIGKILTAKVKSSRNKWKFEINRRELETRYPVKLEPNAKIIFKAFIEKKTVYIQRPIK